MIRRCFVLFVGLIALCSVAGAQTVRGRLVGTVVDKEGRPLPGVTVTVASPALQGSATALTDSAGRFRILMLPPGTYAAKLALKGFQNLEQRDIRIGLEQTITLEVTMPAAFAGEVLVTSDTPLVDVTRTTVGADLGPQLIADLPTGRSYQALTYLVPGAVEGGYENNPSILGSSSLENRIVVDELDVTDPRFGSAGMHVSFNFIQEVQVKTGGYRAEYGGALGGVVNMITKSGSNEFHGDVFAYYTDDSFEAHAKLPRQVGDAVTGYTDWDVGFDLGGKIVRDRLWYFVAANPGFRTDTVVREVFAGDDFAQRNVLEEKLRRDYFAGKLTWQVMTNSSLVASVLGDPKSWDNYTSTYFVDTPYLPTDATGKQDGGSDASWSVTLQSVLSENLLVEAEAGRYDVVYRGKPNSPDLPGYYDVTSDGRWTGGVGSAVGFGGLYYFFDVGRNRDQLRAAVTLFAGDAHQLKVGALATRLRAVSDQHDSGATAKVCLAASEDFSTNDAGYLKPCDSNGDGLADGLLMLSLRGARYLLFDHDYLMYSPDENSHARTDEQGVFIQDSWSITNFISLDLGMRADAIEVRGNTPARSLVPGMSNRIDLRLGDQLAPRLGVIWDFARKGRSKAFAHYGRFYESIPMTINIAAMGAGREQGFSFYYPEAGGLPSLGQDGLPVDPGILVEHWLYPETAVPVDSGLEGQYLDEYLLGAEYELVPNLVVSLTGIYRSLGRVIEDISIDGGATSFITNPGGWYENNPANGEPLAEPVFYPHLSRIFRGVELAAHKWYSDAWQIDASLVWSSTKGNYGGLYDQTFGSRSPNLADANNFPTLLANAYGPLPNDHEWQLKAFGSYRWESGLVTGFALSWLTGAPVSKVGLDLLTLDFHRFVEPRGSSGRTPDLTKLDLHLSYLLRLRGLDLELIADVFNVFNQQKAVTVDERYTKSDDPATDEDPVLRWPYYGEPTRYQAPRNYRVGMKFSW